MARKKIHCTICGAPMKELNVNTRSQWKVLMQCIDCHNMQLHHIKDVI